MGNPHLSPEDKAFLALVSRAAFINPFSDERARVDAEMSQLPAGAGRDQHLDSALARVRDFLEKLEDRGWDDVSLYEDPDRALLVTANLFDIFHRFIEDFDLLIQKQIKAEGALSPAQFSKDTITMLTGRGISRTDACRYLAIFYQMRRAYYFINVSLIGHSPCMKDLRLALWDNVFTKDIRMYERYLWNRMEDFSTLFLGETGTGKGAAATAIGRSGFIPFDEKRQVFSESFTSSFIAINLSQFPESLIESELFGHKKGAFTGAIEAHEGVFARCSQHGSIFLDEIGDVSIPVQIKLLQVLQERVFSPVGSHEKRRFNGRVIAATNRSVDDLMQRGTFRDDFFYRLCSDVIVVPPLRQRISEDADELETLVDSSVHRTIGEKSTELADLVCSVIARDLGPDYTWPGNVRELEQCVRRVLLTRAYKGDRRVSAPDLLSRIVQQVGAGSYEAENLVRDYCALLYSRHNTYEEVARRTNLDRRTVKKYITGLAAPE